MPAIQNDCNVEVNLLADEVSADRIGIKVNVDFRGTCKEPLKERHPETLIRKRVRTTTTKTWTKRIRTTRRNKVKKNEIADADQADAEQADAEQADAIQAGAEAVDGTADATDATATTAADADIEDEGDTPSSPDDTLQSTCFWENVVAFIRNVVVHQHYA